MEAWAAIQILMMLRGSMFIWKCEQSFRSEESLAWNIFVVNDTQLEPDFEIRGNAWKDRPIDNALQCKLSRYDEVLSLKAVLAVRLNGRSLQTWSAETV